MPIGAIIGAGSSLVSGLIGSHGASKAASTQAAAAEAARKKIEEGQNQARDFQTGVWNSTQQAEQPYQSLGSTSANNLRNLLQAGFKAPTLEEAENTPGYQFRLNEGINALDKSAAATGNLYSGTQGKALQNYGQGLAQSTYQQDYQNALNTYLTNYQSLLGGTQIGQNSTAQLGQFGQAAADNMTGIDLGGAQLQAQQLNNAAAARASGYVGSANSWSNAVPGIGAGILQGADWFQNRPGTYQNIGAPNTPIPLFQGTTPGTGF